MVRVRYTGVTQATATFETLRPFHERLVSLQAQCRRTGSDYLVLEGVRKALNTAAYHFTGEPDFFDRPPPA